MSTSLPPAMPGLPLIGNLLEYQRDPVGLLQRGYERYGPIFSIRLGPRRAAVLLGPDHHQFFFAQTGTILSRRQTLKWMIAMFGGDFPVVTEGEHHRRLLPVYSLPFRESRMAGYAATMARHTTRWLNSLGDGCEIELVSAMRRLITTISASIILSDELVERVGDELPALLADLASGTSTHVLRNLTRVLPHGRRTRAEARLMHMVRQVIAGHRAAREPHADFVAALLDADLPSVGMDDEFLAHLLIGLTWVGLDTTTGHLCWALVHLLQHRGCLDRVATEATSVLGDAPAPGIRHLDELIYLHQALKETERLAPAVRVIGRIATEPFELGGFTVPAGWLTLLSPPVAHRLASVFADPNRYDPDRFGPARAEDRRTPFALIGFGGGRHICAGRRLALLQMKTIISLLVTRYDLELLTPQLEPAPGPHTNHPCPPVTVRCRRRDGRST